MSDDSTRLAVLIDADNTSPKLIKEMFEELASYGTITVKRAYGDWTSPHLNGWRSILLGNAISPEQQFAYTYGKNATDSALIIDAMDLLYSGNVEGFAIVSSDSDFTPLATRLRESGKRVIGVGRRTTPKAFVEACERFLFLEVLGGDGEATEQATESAKDDQPRPLQSVLAKALNKVDTDDEDWGSAHWETTSIAPIPPSTHAATGSASSVTWSRRSHSSSRKQSPHRGAAGSCGCGSKGVDPSRRRRPGRPRCGAPRRWRKHRPTRRPGRQRQETQHAAHSPKAPARPLTARISLLMVCRETVVVAGGGRRWHLVPVGSSPHPRDRGGPA
jgi:uncharacterized protein (TIGR00288 family)